jgi:hypothetical protein
MFLYGRTVPIYNTLLTRILTQWHCFVLKFGNKVTQMSKVSLEHKSFIHPINNSNNTEEIPVTEASNCWSSQKTPLLK